MIEINANVFVKVVLTGVALVESQITERALVASTRFYKRGERYGRRGGVTLEEDQWEFEMSFKLADDVAIDTCVSTLLNSGSWDLLHHVNNITSKTIYVALYDERRRLRRFVSASTLARLGMAGFDLDVEDFS